MVGDCDSRQCGSSNITLKISVLNNNVTVEDNNVNMSGKGCGQCRGHGCGGRGNSGRGSYGRGHRNQSGGYKSGNNSNSKSTGEQKKMFEPHCAGKHQADACDSVKEKIIVQVQKNFKNAEKTVLMLREEDEDKTKLMKPTLTKEPFVDSNRVTLKDGARVEADLKQEENNMMFQEDLHSHDKRKEQMEDNTQKGMCLDNE